MYKAILLTIMLLLSQYSIAAKEEYKVAIVDVETVLINSSAMTGLKNILETLSKELQEEFSKKEQELRNEEAKLLLEKDKLKPEEFEKLVLNFNSKVTKAQKSIQDKKYKLEQANSEAVSEVNTVALKIISEISLERGFSIVFPSTQVVYASESLNITKEVITRLNNKIPSVKLKF
jgi:outer membrane protein